MKLGENTSKKIKKNKFTIGQRKKFSEIHGKS